MQGQVQQKFPHLKSAKLQGHLVSGEEIPFWLPPKAGLREASAHVVPSQDLALPTELPENGRTMKAQDPDVHLLAPFSPVFHR